MAREEQEGLQQPPQDQQVSRRGKPQSQGHGRKCRHRRKQTLRRVFHASQTQVQCFDLCALFHTFFFKTQVPIGKSLCHLNTTYFQGHLPCHHTLLASNVSHWLPAHNCFIFLHTESNTGSCIIFLRPSTSAPHLLIYHYLYYSTRRREH